MLRIAAGADEVDPQPFRVDVGRSVGDRHPLIRRHRIAHARGDGHGSGVHHRIRQPIDVGVDVDDLVRQVQLAVGRAAADVAGVGHEADRGTARSRAGGRRIDSDRQAAARRAWCQQIEAASGEHRRTVGGDAAVECRLLVAGGLVEYGQVLVGGGVDAYVAEVNSDGPRVRDAVDHRSGLVDHIHLNVAGDAVVRGTDAERAEAVARAIDRAGADEVDVDAAVDRTGRRRVDADGHRAVRCGAARASEDAGQRAAAADAGVTRRAEAGVQILDEARSHRLRYCGSRGSARPADRPAPCRSSAAP